MEKNKGSITIFSLLALLLITAALFALLEATRIQELRRFTLLQSENAMESAFSNYDLYLWEEYHLLGCDREELEEILQKAANGKEGEGVNLLTFRLKNYEMVGDTRITDGGGNIFIQSVSSYMKSNLLYESTKELYNQYEVVKDLLNTSQVDEKQIEEALEEIDSAVQNANPVSIGTSAKKEGEKQLDVSKLLTEAKKWKEYGVLELVIEDTSTVSSAASDFSNGLLVRELKCGKNSSEDEINWLDRILLQQYLLSYMSNFLEQYSERALTYEVEYLLGGKSSDKENLQLVVSKILAIREAANFLYLISDPIKNQEAEGLATSIGGVSLNPAIIKVIKVGILTAWALAESILDVRALLEGKRIPLLKSQETWTIELENIMNITKEFSTAKDSALGLNYENYLGILLLFENENHLAMYAMSAQEATLRKKAGSESFEMDRLVIQADAEICYSYTPVFPFMNVLDIERSWKYEIPTYIEYGYYD